MKSVLPTLILAALLSLLAAFAPGSASAGEHGYYGEGYYGEGYYGEGYYGGGYDSSCCGRGLLTSPRVYVVPAEPVYVVPARPVYVAPLPVYVAPSRRVYVEDYGYRRRGSVYYEANRYYRPRGYYYGN
jgi:hypothetical protein